MRYKQSIAKVLSIVMMIVLTQKIAGGLYLHNWLHESKQTSLVSHSDHAVSQANCSCIDDFYAAFTEPVGQPTDVLLSPEASFFAVRELSLPLIAKYFHSLRAPPVSSLFSA